MLACDTIKIPGGILNNQPLPAMYRLYLLTLKQPITSNNDKHDNAIKNIVHIQSPKVKTLAASMQCVSTLVKGKDMNVNNCPLLLKQETCLAGRKIRYAMIFFNH